MKLASKRVFSLLLALLLVFSNVSGILPVAYATETEEVISQEVTEVAPVSEVEAEEPAEEEPAAEEEAEEPAEEEPAAEEEETPVEDNNGNAEEPVIEDAEGASGEEIVDFVSEEIVASSAAMMAVADSGVAGLGMEYTEGGANKEDWIGEINWNAEKNAQSGAVTIRGSISGMPYVATNGNTNYRKEVNTLTLTNNLEQEAVLSFTYELSVAVYNKDQITIDGVAYVGLDSGSTDSSVTGFFEKTLQSGDSVEIYTSVAAKTKTSNAASIVLRDVTLNSNPEVTTKFLLAENGSYTVAYGETTVEVTEETTVANKATTNYTLTATPAEGYSFAGWYDNTNQVYFGGLATSENVRFTDEATVAVVEPLFIKTEDAVYGAGEARFLELEPAVTYAVNTPDKVIVVLKDDTLEAEYTIPAGVTLLVPFDKDNTLYTDKPGTTASEYNNAKWVYPTAYRTLTLASGAQLNVEGIISVSAQHTADATNAGSPTGPYGHIVLNSNAKINVADGGVLYAWGYITGSGEIEVKSGGEVWENLQITDFRGGNASVSMLPANEDDPLLAEKKVFPFSQYYAQNIETALKINSGAIERVYTSIYALDKVYPTPGIEFIGTDSSMFSIGEGSYVVKDYDPSTDRLNIFAYGSGDISVNALSVTMAGNTLNSSMFNLPITNNITINVYGGSVNIDQDVALLPGSQVNIARGATLNMGSGYNVFVYDQDDWTKGIANVRDAETGTYSLVEVENCNFVHNNKKLTTVPYSPSNKADRTEASLVDAKVDVNGTLNVEGSLYTTSGGANILSSEGTGVICLNTDALGDATHTNQVTQNVSAVTFVNIPVTPAKLKNADGSYTNTADMEPVAAYTYDSASGKWVGKNSYTVTFDGNGAAGSVAPMKVTFTDVYISGECEIELPGPTGFEKENAEFLGWSTDKDAEDPDYFAEDFFEVTEDVTLYAIWAVETGVVNFVTDDADMKSAVEALSGDVEVGECTLPAVPEKTGYEGHWELDGKTVTKVNVTVEKDLTVKAVYTIKKIALTFDANGGKFADGKSTYGGDHDYGTLIYDIDPPAQEGYKFIGWNTQTDGKGKAPNFGTDVLTEATTYYAQWEELWHTFSFVDENGNALTITEGAVKGQEGKEYTLPVVPAKTGYVGHWELNGETVIKIDKVTGSLTFTAVYVPVEYTITWVIDGVESTTKQAYQTAILAPAATSKEGHTFAGWQYSVNGAIYQPDAEIVKVPLNGATITLTSKWTVNSYKLILTNAEEEGEIHFEKEFKFGETIPVIPDPVRKGYEFEGWNNKIPETMPAHDVELYATWSDPIWYSIKWYVDGKLYHEETSPYGFKVDAPEYEITEGYDFSGWKDAEGNVVSSFNMPDHDVELHATLKPKTFAVTLQGTGVGFEGGVAPVATYGQDLTVKLVSLLYANGLTTRDDVFVLDFYYGKDNQGVTKTADNGIFVIDKKFITGDIRISARALVEFTVNLQGGTVSESYKEFFTENEGIVTMPDSPYSSYQYEIEFGMLDKYFTRDGYNLASFKDQNGKTYAADDIVYLNGDMHLTAVWECLHEETKAVDNGDGKTHKIICTNPECNGTVINAQVAHNFENAEHKCVCDKLESFTVTWVNQAGETVDTETVEYGKNATKTPTVPAKEGYDGKWEQEVVGVKSDLTIKPVYTIQSYDITWNVEGEETTTKVEYNQIPSYGANNPTKATVGCTTYTFAGWSLTANGTVLENLPAATGPETYYAVFTTGSEHKFTMYRKGSLKDEGDCLTKAKYAYMCDYCEVESETLVVEGERNLSKHATPDSFTYSVKNNTHDKMYACCSTVIENVPHSFDYRYEFMEGNDAYIAHNAFCVCGAKQEYELHAENAEGYCGCGAFQTILDLNGGKLISAPETTRLYDWNIPGDAKNHLGITEEDIAFYNSIYVKDGYKIVGFAYDAAGTQPYNGEVYTGPTTFYFAWECAHLNTTATDNGDGTHKVVCSNGHVLEEKAEHNFENAEHKCVCGKVESFTVTWVNEDDETVDTETVEYGKNATKNPTVPAKEGYNGAWEEIGEVKADVTVKPVYTAIEYTLTIYAMDFANGNDCISNAVEVDVPYGALVKDYLPADCGEEYNNNPIYQPGETITVAGKMYNGIWTITGWLGSDEVSVNQDIDLETFTMPAGGMDITQSYVFTGWVHNWYDENGDWLEESNGTMYCVADEYIENTVAHIDGDAYLFDENGFIVAGAGLVRHVTEEGVVEYYYFCDAENCVDGCEEASYTGFKSGVHWLSLDNGLLPKWDYSFDNRGVILHREDTSLNGLVDEGEDTFYFIDGVPAYMGMIEVDGDVFYVRSSGKIVKNQSYWISKTNGVRPEGTYAFDAEGKLIEEKEEVKSGIVAENGGLYYYVDGELNYAGLIEIDGAIYYVRSNGQLVVGQKYWISKTNGLRPEKSYTFDEDGKLQENIREIKDGYYYVDGVKTYGGLIELDGNLYYVNSSCKVVKNCEYWISKTNGLKPEGSYTFDAEGRLVEEKPEDKLNGIVDGYYYVNGVKTYAGLVEIEGKYYYVNSSCQIVTGRKYWISKTNDLMPERSYTFDANGVMQDPAPYA